LRGVFPIATQRIIRRRPAASAAVLARELAFAAAAKSNSIDTFYLENHS
jgi:hypothetical protein